MIPATTSVQARCPKCGKSLALQLETVDADLLTPILKLASLIICNECKSLSHPSAIAKREFKPSITKDSVRLPHASDRDD